MQQIVHSRLGYPSEVLSVAEAPEPAPSAGTALVRVAYAPIHPGDLLGIAGSPAFGSPPLLGDEARVPGVEGSGVIEALGSEIDPALGLTVGDRVAFFPVNGTWRGKLVAPASSLVRLPAEIPQESAAQILVNSVTASLVLRAGHNALPDDRRTNVVVLQTAAGSAVGRLLTLLLLEVGVTPIRLVHSAASAAALRRRLPGPVVIATSDANWKDAVLAAVGGREVHVAFDATGGPLLGDLAGVLESGGAVISYGSLGGPLSDVRSFVPKSLTLQGVSIWGWGRLPDELREQDIRTALRLAVTYPEQFAAATPFAPTEIISALRKTAEPGRPGGVLWAF